MSAAAARTIAKKYYAAVLSGQDPRAEKAKATAAAEAETFGAMLPAYFTHKAGELRPRSFVEMKRYLLVDAKSLHDAPLAEIAHDR
jgi:hypothetical protein